MVHTNECSIVDILFFVFLPIYTYPESYKENKYVGMEKEFTRFFGAHFVGFFVVGVKY